MKLKSVEIKALLKRNSPYDTYVIKFNNSNERDFYYNILKGNRLFGNDFTQDTSLSSGYMYLVIRGISGLKPEYSIAYGLCQGLDSFAEYYGLGNYKIIRSEVTFQYYVGVLKKCITQYSQKWNYNPKQIVF